MTVPGKWPLWLVCCSIHMEQFRLIDPYMEFSFSSTYIKKRPDGLTNLPLGKVDAKAGAAPNGATNREMRRPSTDSLEGFL